MGAVTKALAKAVEADDAAGATLIGMVVYDYLADQAQAVGEDLNRLLGSWALDRLGVAKRQLGRSYVEKAASGEYPDDSVHVAAEWLAGLEAYVMDAVTVSKETVNYEGWARRNVRRDTKGRFARDLSGAGTPNVQSRMENAKDLVAPNVKAMMARWEELEAPMRERMRVHQGQWEQAGDVLAQMASALRPQERAGVDAILTLRKPSGQIDEIAFPLEALKGNRLPDAVGVKWDVNEDGLTVSLEAGRNASPETERRIAAFNSLGMVGGTALQRLAEVEPARWEGLGNSLAMPRTDTDQSSLSRFFNQLSAGGRVLSQISGQERMGEWAQFVGTMGPQAEQVLGPYVQRAAYRYRGTEKTPDRELVGMLANSDIKDASIAANARTLEGGSLEMQARADVAAAYLATTLPKDPILRRLSQASGNVLPSQGVLLDAEGNVVSQAVGYADDHYLPFDLKGLASLRGGQYVRTRMMGGPTAEDIYAAVHTGARMLTVVSPSGVYTLEFDPSFRGARAGSDKARQMNDRYIKILDAVKGSGLYLQDIDQSARNTIINEANRAYPGNDKTSEEMRETLISRRINQARMDGMSLDESDIQSLQNDAREQMGVGPDEAMRPSVARQYEDVLESLIDQKRNENVRALKLNGEGYAVALQTLQQQFPYFLKAPRYMDYDEFRQSLVRPAGLRAARGARFTADSGYVGPGGLRPASTGTGFYQFQGLDRQTKREIRDGVRPGETPPAAGVSAGGGGPAPTPDAPAAAAAAGTDAQPEAPVPSTGVWGRLRSNRPLLEKKRQDLVVGLMSQIGGVRDEYRANGNALAQMDDEKDALRSDPDTLARWFLTRDPKQIKSLLTAADSDPAVGNTLMPVLQNRDIMEKAFSDVMGGARVGNEDYFSVEGNKIGGETTIAGAARWVADTATQIANLTYAREPFAPAGTDRASVERHTGLKPQGFDDLTAISTRDAFEQVWAGDPATATLASQLMESEDGEAYTIGQTAKVASDRINALNALEAAMPKLAAGDPDALAEQGVDRADISRTLGIRAADLESEAAGMDFGAQRYQTQRAWTLATVGRLLQYLPSTDGGDVDPKAWDPLGNLAGPSEVDKQTPDWEGLMSALRVTSMLLPRQLAP